MLKIINDLKPFFEDNYRRINVREYARLQSISPPTASKVLSKFQKKQLLAREEDKQNIYYYANKDSDVFIDLSRIYWKLMLKNNGLLELFDKELLNPIVILFGSLSKAEVRDESDIDLAIFTPTKKDLKLEEVKKRIKRNIQLFIFKTKEDVKNPQLLNSILNGYTLMGGW